MSNLQTASNGPQIIDLPKYEDPRGNLSIIEEQLHIPFSIERVYWIFDVPGGQARGAHAFKEQHEFIVAISGSFDVIVEDGRKKWRYHLNRSYFGLYLPPGTWRHMEEFSTNSLALVASSRPYEEADYIRDYEQFRAFIENKQHL